MIKENFRLMMADLRLRFKRSEMPKVKLPRSVRILRAAGALRVRVEYDHSIDKFRCTSQLRWWHPLSWLLVGLGFAAAERFLALPQCFREHEWRAGNG
jgi:hypothetical protein